jgi:GWxTD domain-containing protein
MKLRLFRWMFASFSIVAVFCALAAAQDSPASNKSSGQPASQPASSSTPAGSAATTPTGSAAASTGTNAAGTAPAQAGDQSDPLKRSLTQEQKKKNSKALKQELSGTYKKWLKEDVVYIITPEEVSAFKALSNDEERDQFIENFWLRRDPTPDTPENEYKEEHYRRIAYANEHFGAGLPGWKTDRGRIYIIWGAPDQIESHPTGGTWDRPQEQGGGTTSTYPYEDWRYRYLEGIQENVELEFVDPCSCGDYHLTSDPNEKDALLHTPGGSTMYEQMGIGNRANRMDPYAPNTSPE